MQRVLRVSVGGCQGAAPSSYHCCPSRGIRRERVGVLGYGPRGVVFMAPGFEPSCFGPFGGNAPRGRVSTRAVLLLCCSADGSAAPVFSASWPSNLGAPFFLEISAKMFWNGMFWNPPNSAARPNPPPDWPEQHTGKSSRHERGSANGDCSGSRKCPHRSTLLSYSFCI